MSVLDRLLAKVGAMVDQAQARDREVAAFRAELARLPDARRQPAACRGQQRGVIRRIRARLLHHTRTRAAWAELTRGAHDG